MVVLYSLFGTTNQLPYFSMAPELTKDYDERILLVGYRSTCGVVGIFFIKEKNIFIKKKKNRNGCWSFFAWDID